MASKKQNNCMQNVKRIHAKSISGDKNIKSHQTKRLRARSTTIAHKKQGCVTELRKACAPDSASTKQFSAGSKALHCWLSPADVHLVSKWLDGLHDRNVRLLNSSVERAAEALGTRPAGKTMPSRK